MELEIVRADPAGNITIFIMNPPENQKIRIKALMTLLADKNLGAEQAGFVFPPEKPGENWRLEMAGGEFCANASRSLGLLIAAKTGISGKHTMMLETSGMPVPVPVHIDTGAQTAEIEIPGTQEEKEIFMDGKNYPVYVFEGITHIIAADIPPDEETVHKLICETDRQAEGQPLCSALGVMFFDSRKCLMRPVVWTRTIDTLVRESSCGSGTAAMGAWLTRNEWETDRYIDIEQPGGTITVHVIKQNRKINQLSISGKVTLSETMRYDI